MVCCLTEARWCLQHNCSSLITARNWKRLPQLRVKRILSADMQPPNGVGDVACQALGGEGVFAVSPAVEESNPKTPTKVKRKVALHIGYVGTGYQGLESDSN